MKSHTLRLLVLILFCSMLCFIPIIAYGDHEITPEEMEEEYVREAYHPMVWSNVCAFSFMDVTNKRHRVSGYSYSVDTSFIVDNHLSFDFNEFIGFLNSAVSQWNSSGTLISMTYSSSSNNVIRFCNLNSSTLEEDMPEPVCIETVSVWETDENGIRTLRNDIVAKTYYYSANNNGHLTHNWY